MIRKLTMLRILVLACAAALLPTLAWGDACQQTSVSNLIGTTCTIGDVAYTFGSSAFSSASVINGVDGSGIDASALLFTPDASSPLDPSFTISGPLSVTATAWETPPNSSLRCFGPLLRRIIRWHSAAQRTLSLAPPSPALQALVL